MTRFSSVTSGWARVLSMLVAPLLLAMALATPAQAAYRPGLAGGYNNNWRSADGPYSALDSYCRIGTRFLAEKRSGPPTANGGFPVWSYEGGDHPNRTWIFSGEVYLAANTYYFAAEMGGSCYLNIDGTTLFDDGSWNLVSRGQITLATGWHTITMRFSPEPSNPGDDIVGPMNQDSWGTTTFGLGYNTTGHAYANPASASYTPFPDDPGDGSFLRNSFDSVGAPAAADFNYSMIINLTPPTAGEFENFPVLIKLANGVGGFNYNKMGNTNGYDLAFYGANGAIIPHEIDKWNTNGTSYIWVNMPRLGQVAAGAANTINLRYGAVTPANFASARTYTANGSAWDWLSASVSHRTAGAALLDNSVAGVGDGSNNGSTDTTGYMGDATRHNTAAGASAAHADMLNGHYYAFDYWVKVYADTSAHVQRFLEQPTDSGYFIIWGANNASSLNAFSSVASLGVADTSILTDGNWHHVAVSYYAWSTGWVDPQYYLYVDGVKVKNGGAGAWPGSMNGGRDFSCPVQSGEGVQDSAMDEVRMHKIPRGTNWWMTAYKTAAANASMTEYVAPGPLLATPTVTLVGPTFATLGATVSSDSGNAITEYGIVWNTTGIPTTSDNKVQKGTSVSAPSTFTVNATGLPALTHVYYRGYAMNSIGTGYSTQGDFWTIPATIPSGYSYSRAITFGTVGSAQAYFPALVKFTNYTGFVRSDGGDLRFTDSSGNILKHEVESWNSEGTSHVWVRVPSLTTGTNIYAFWGHASATLPSTSDQQQTWDSDYIAVYHMDESSGDNTDSTTNGLTGSRGNNSSATGIAGDGQLFVTGSGRGIEVADNDKLDPTSITVEAWVNDSSWGNWGRIVDKNWNSGYVLGEYSDSANWDCAIGGGDVQVTATGSGTRTVGWHYGAMTYDTTEGNRRMYQDGSLLSGDGTAWEGTGAMGGNSSSVGIGSAGSGTGYGDNFSGTLDEVRLSRVARSANWIDATYQTINNNSTWTTYGTGATAGSSEPTSQADNPTFGDSAGSSMTVNLSGGDGTYRLVVAKAGSAPSADPVDGAIYTANAAYENGTGLGGGYVVYAGSGSSFSLSGLTPGSTYYFKVYAFNGSGGGENYLTTSPGAASVLSGAAPTMTTAPSSPFATIDTTSATLGATVDSNGGVALSSRGTWYNTADTVDNATVEGGTAEGAFSHNRTGLTAGTLYYYGGYAVNTVGTTYSSHGSFYTEPNQATVLQFSGVSGTGMTIGWTKGASAAGTIVVVKNAAYSSATADPADGTSTYTAHTTLGSGTEIGGGSVVYFGTGASVAITGLTQGNTYYVSVYTYQGSSSQINYQQTSPLQNTQVAAAVATLTVGAATLVTGSSATLAATITDDGGSAITERGTVYSTSEGPRYADNHSDEGGRTTDVFTQSRTGLSAGTHYYYAGYAVTEQGTGYSPDAEFYTQPGQAATVTFASISDTAMTINWSKGTSADGSLVVVRDGAYPSSGPSYGVTYSASTVFGSGDSLGSGRVVYNSTGSSVDITGLTKGNTYYVYIYAYKGSSTLISYNTTSPAQNSQLARTTPTLTTPTAPFATIDTTSATLGATVSDNGGAALSARGTWYNTSATKANASAASGTDVGAFTHSRSSLTAGTLYYYGGYAVNAAGTGYSSDGTFYTEPLQASAVNFTSISGTGLTINWTQPASAAGCVVYVKDGGAPGTAPTDGAAAGSVGDDLLVYDGSGTSVAMTGLTQGNTYYVKVYAYAGSSTLINYQQDSPAEGNQLARTTPTLTTPTAPFATIDTTSATLGATVSDNGGAALSARGTWYNTSATKANASAASGTDVGAFTHSRSSLTAGTLYYYGGYAVNAAGTGYSSDGTFYTEPLQASAVAFTSVSGSGLTINWTQPASAAGCVVYVKDGGAPSTTPSDGSATGAGDAAYGGSGDQLVYNGADTHVAITGLTAGHTYYVTVFSYAGSSGQINYQQDSPATGSLTANVDTTGYASNMKIKFTGYTGRSTSLENFPVLVKLSTAIPGFAYDQFLSTSDYDLRFKDSAGNEIPYEVDTWNTAGTSYVWVQVPALVNDGSSYITAYWGKSDVSAPGYAAGAVWDANFSGVYHLNDSVGDHNVIADSTGNQQDGQQHTLEAYSGVDAIGQAMRSDVDDVISLPGALLSSGSYTKHMWVRTEDATSWGALFFGDGGDAEHTNSFYTSNMGLAWPEGGNVFANNRNDDSENVSDADALTRNAWHHVALVNDQTAATIRLYVDGLQKGVRSTAVQDPYPANAVYVLGTSTVGGFSPDHVSADDVRASLAVRSADWIWAEYKTGGDNAAFTTYVPANDSDGDGLPDVWEVTYFNNLDQNGSGDPDEDGWNNLQEYVAGTSPIVAASYLNITVDLEAEALDNIKVQVAAGANATLDNDLSVSRRFRIMAGNTARGAKTEIVSVADIHSGVNEFIDTNAVNVSSTRFYTVAVTMGNRSYTNTENWVAFTQTRGANRKYMVCVPVTMGVSTQNNLNSTLGRQLGRGLKAYAYGDTPASIAGNADAIQLWTADKTYAYYYWVDNGSRQFWWDPEKAGDADVPMDPGQPFWIVRKSGTAPRSNMVVVGRAVTNAAPVQFKKDAGGWNMFGWPLYDKKTLVANGVNTPVNQLGLETSGTGGTAPSRTDATCGDQLYLWNGSIWKSYWLMNDNTGVSNQWNGRWWDASKNNYATFSLDPGTAYFYWHATGTHWNVTNFFWRPTL